MLYIVVLFFYMLNPNNSMIFWLMQALISPITAMSSEGSNGIRFGRRSVLWTSYVRLVERTDLCVGAGAAPWW